MLETLSIIPRSLFSLIALFFITKMIGKKQVSELSLFDYVIGISIGNFTAEMTLDLDGHYMHGVIAMLVFGLFAWFVSFITMHSIKLRRFLVGVPTYLIENGKIIEKNLKKTMLDINDLLEECRIGGVFDISEIEYAIMEANGKISILLKKNYMPVSVKDMNLILEPTSLCANIIIDGNIMTKNLQNSGKNEDWLYNQLNINNKKLQEILLATLDRNNNLIFYEKNQNLEIKNVLE